MASSERFESDLPPDLARFVHSQVGQDDMASESDVLREAVRRAAELDALQATARRDLMDDPVPFWRVFAFLMVYDPSVQPIGIARVLHGSRDLAALFTRHPPRA